MDKNEFVLREQQHDEWYLQPESNEKIMNTED